LPPGLLGEVGGELLQRLLLAHGRRRHGAAGFTRRAPPAADEPSLAPCPSSGEPATILGSVVGQVVGLDALELARDGEQRVAQDGS
jgi:hypothetical protein